MANHLEQTWVAYALDAPENEDELETRCRRVRAHTQSFFSEPVEEDRALGLTLGQALWRRPDQRLRAPLWMQNEDLTLASTSALVGSRALSAGSGNELAAVAATLLADPSVAVRLNPPFVVGALDANQDSMVIVNDVVGAGRLFELETSAGTVWSNRIGALVAFCGRRPPLDQRAWQVLAATGWFLGETTSLEGVRKLRSASMIRATRSGERTTVRKSRNLEGIRELVGPRRIKAKASARAAAAAARNLAEDVGASWDCPISVDLSGGRDSRVSAAAAISAGIDLELRTSDLEHGEVDLVSELVERAPGTPDHRVVETEHEPDDPLSERLAAIHLVHDGMRNPQSVLRSSMPIPHGPLEWPVISGHGGELGHGFYYDSKAEIRMLRHGGREALIERLDRTARKKHGAAHEAAYEAYLEEARKTVREGESLGLKGPAVLDYYYLAQRLANRSGLTTRNERWSACSTPAFIRACFDLSPKERLKSRMHRLVVSELLPEWADAPYFERSENAPETKRTRIWDKPGHREELGEMVMSDESWHDLFDVEAVRAAWSEALRGDAHPHWETVFTRVAWRSSFEGHLRALDRAAGS